MNFSIKPILVGMVLSITTGCASMGNFNQGKGSTDVLTGPGITRNNTPYTAGLMCVGEHINVVKHPARKLRISVGDIPDLTGKFTDNDGGYKVTQGAALMAVSALGKMKAVSIVERGDTKIFDFEIKLADKKVLGDNTVYRMPDGKTINYRPIKSGSVSGSDYYITGGITEINYNIRSGGAELDVGGTFAGMRQYVMNIAMDLRIVDSRTLEIADTLTLQKQIIGYETKAGVFKFFGVELVDLNAGNKVDEPIQLGIRAIVEQGIGELIASLYDIDAAAYFKRGEDLTLAINEPTDTEEDSEKVREFNDHVRLAIIDPRKFANENICPDLKPEPVIPEIAPVVEKKKEAPKKEEPKPVFKKVSVIPKSGYGGACALDGEDATELTVHAKPPLTVQPTGIYVQMATFEREFAVHKEWACLELKQNKDLFGAETYIIKDDKIQGKPVKSLLVGPQASYTEAKKLCEDAVSRGLGCYVRNVKTVESSTK